MTIEPDGDDHLGYSVMDDPRFSWQRGDGPKRPIVEAFCMALFAGAEAEKFFLGSVDIGDGVDCDRATNCLAWLGLPGASYVGDEVFDRNEARLRAKARVAVIQHRAAIQRVAAALVEHRTLSGDQVDALIR
ncbi:hypothetical protein P9272_32730 [Mesorhizobium sp. WSM4976]|uniref:hypothetical protein n=1 Tax=Mesorhizobium sp. WSM4976 TaxID=3038549 RepID=UPI0024160571|nr:hypothetical protein [Mesorhizobium sp. WSM4976]MDG4898301.1 hypothetical protein [Mesorhizobium sp. WSM4976]